MLSHIGFSSNQALAALYELVYNVSGSLNIQVGEYNSMEYDYPDNIRALFYINRETNTFRAEINITGNDLLFTGKISNAEIDSMIESDFEIEDSILTDKQLSAITQCSIDIVTERIKAIKSSIKSARMRLNITVKEMNKLKSDISKFKAELVNISDSDKYDNEKLIENRKQVYSLIIRSNRYWTRRINKLNNILEIAKSDLGQLQ